MGGAPPLPARVAAGAPSVLLLAAFLAPGLLACSPPPPPPCVELEVTIRIPPGIAPPSPTGARTPGVRTAALPPYRLTADGRGARVLEGLEPGCAPAVFCLEPGEWQLVLEAGTAVPSRAIAEVVRPGPLHLVIPPPTLP